MFSLIIISLSSSVFNLLIPAAGGALHLPRRETRRGEEMIEISDGRVNALID